MGKTRFRLWVALAAGIVLAGFSAFVAIGSVISISGARHGGAGLGASITTASIGIVIVIACVRWAVRVEHRLRTRDPGHHGAGTQHAGTQHAGASRPPAGGRSPGGHRPRLYHHRHGPVAATAGAVFFTVIGLGMAIGAVQAFGSWRLSGYVQAHGRLVPAAVVSVHNIEHTGRSTWFTADIAVILHRPVGGTIITTVYDPTASGMIPGQTAPVRVDPHRAGYAEFPGKPYGDLATWIVLAVFAALMLLVAGVYWSELAVRVRQRYQPASLPLPAQTSA